MKISGKEVLIIIKNEILIEMLPARAGDCFLITFMEDDYRILIDGGYKSTYLDYLKPKLLELSGEGKCIDLLVVTHIDDDHIQGIIELLLENGDSDNPLIIKIKDVWFNSFYQFPLVEENNEKLDIGERLLLEEMITNGQGGNDDSSKNSAISAKLGTALSYLLKKGAYNLNAVFNGNAVIKTDENLRLTSQLSIVVLNPEPTDIDKLMDLWMKELRKKRADFHITTNDLCAKAFEAYVKFIDNIDTVISPISLNDYEKSIDELCAYPDEAIDCSRTNRSSIALAIQYKKYNLLFPGDMPCQLLMERIRKRKFDIIKLPHHGSGKNYSTNLFECYPASYYLLSTDGKKYDHPSEILMAKILSCDLGSKIITNYSLKYESKLKDSGNIIYSNKIDL